MEAEFPVLHNRGNDRIRFEEDLLPVESQHEERKAGETGLPSRVPKSLIATSMVLFAVTLDDQAIADQQIDPFPVGERDAYLQKRRASGPRRKNLTTLSDPVSARRSPFPHVNTSGMIAFAAAGSPAAASSRSKRDESEATEKGVEDCNGILLRLGGHKLPEHVGQQCDTECVAERASAARRQDPDILAVAVKRANGNIGIPEVGRAPAYFDREHSARRHPQSSCLLQPLVALGNAVSRALPVFGHGRLDRENGGSIRGRTCLDSDR